MNLWVCPAEIENKLSTSPERLMLPLCKGSSEGWLCFFGQISPGDGGSNSRRTRGLVVQHLAVRFTHLDETQKRLNTVGMLV